MWYYGNETFKDGEVGYFYFKYLSNQIPALEAKTILMTSEGHIFGQGNLTPQSKKRLNQLQRLVQYGITE